MSFGVPGAVPEDVSASQRLQQNRPLSGVEEAGALQVSDLNEIDSIINGLESIGQNPRTERRAPTGLTAASNDHVSTVASVERTPTSSGAAVSNPVRTGRSASVQNTHSVRQTPVQSFQAVSDNQPRTFWQKVKSLFAPVKRFFLKLFGGSNHAARVAPAPSDFVPSPISPSASVGVHDATASNLDKEARRLVKIRLTELHRTLLSLDMRDDDPIAQQLVRWQSVGSTEWNVAEMTRYFDEKELFLDRWTNLKTQVAEVLDAKVSLLHNDRLKTVIMDDYHRINALTLSQRVDQFPIWLDRVSDFELRDDINTRLINLQQDFIAADMHQDDPLKAVFDQHFSNDIVQWDISEMNRFIDTQQAFLNRWITLRDQMLAFKRSEVDQIEDERVRDMMLSKCEEVNRLPIAERLEKFPDWMEWVGVSKSYFDQVAVSKREAAEAIDRYEKAFNAFKVDELHFQRGFMNFKIFMAKEFSYIEHNLLKEPKSKVKRLLGEGNFQEDTFAVFIHQIKDLYLELEFKEVYTHYINTQYLSKDARGNFTNGLRSTEQIRLDISRKISEYLDQSGRAQDRDVQDRMTEILDRAMEKPLKGLVEASRRNGSVFVAFSLSKDAFAAIPRFYATALHAMQEDTALAGERDLSDLSSDQVAAQTRDLAARVPIMRSLAGNAEAQLVGSAEELEFEHKRFESQVQTAVKKYCMEHPEEDPSQFTDDFIHLVSDYVYLRAKDKHILNSDGTFVATEKTLEKFSLVGKEKSKQSYQIFKRLFAPEKRGRPAAPMAEAFSKIQDQLSEFVTASFDRLFHVRGLGAQARMLRDGADRSEAVFNQLERAKTAFVLKWRNVSTGSLFTKAKSVVAAYQFYSDNLTTDALTEEDSIMSDLGDIPEKVEKVRSVLEQADSFVSHALAAIDVNADQLHGVLSHADQLLDQFKGVLDHVESLTDQVPYYGQIKAGASLLVHLGQFAHQSQKVKEFGRQMVAMKQMSHYFTSDEINDPAIKAQIADQISTIVKLTHSDEAADRALGNALLDVINLASPIQVGSLIREVAGFFTLSLDKKEQKQIYERIAQDTLTIVSSYNQVARGRVEDQMQQLLTQLKTKPETDYYVSFAAQSVADHLPNAGVWREAVDTFVGAQLAEVTA